MKDILLYWRFLLLFTFLFFTNGCDNQKSDTKEIGNQRLVLRLGHQGTLDSAQHKGALLLSEKINEISRDTISVYIYPQGQLGSDDEMLEMTQHGKLDIALLSTATVSKIEPAFGLFDIPFLFHNESIAHQVIDGKVGNLLFSKLSTQDLLGLTIWESGFSQVLSKRNDQLFINALKRLESDLYERSQKEVALQTRISGVFSKLDQSAIEDTLKNLVSAKNDRSEQLTLSNHLYNGHVFLLSKSQFNGFSPKVQQWVTQAVLSVTKEQRLNAKTMNNQALEQLSTSGIIVRKTQNADEIAKQEALAQTVVEKFRHKIGSDILEHLLQKIHSIDADLNKFWLVGLDADLTSHSAKSGLSIKRGMEIALDEINQSGGWLGKRVKLISRDNAMIPAKGLENIRYFSTLDNLVAVFGGISSPVTLAEIPLIHQHRIIFLDPWAAATNIIDNGYDPNYIFRVSVRDEYAAPFLLGEAFKQSKSVGLLLVNNPWGRSNFEALSTTFNHAKAVPSHVEWFNWGESDMESKIQRLQEMGSDTIIYVGNSVEAVKMVQEVARLEKPMRVISHWGITGGNFSKMAGDDLKKVDLKVLQTITFINNNKPKVVAFSDKYKSKYFVDNVADIVAPVGSAHAYDLMHLLSNAINKAQSTSSVILQQQLENLDAYSGLVKDYDKPFSKSKHDALTVESFILATYENGVLVPAKVKDELDKN